MKALILRDDPEASVACAKVLSDKGFQVICVETRHIARALLRIETVDVLIMDERLDGRLTHSIALSAERRLPFISTLIMTDRSRSESDDLFDLIPSLYCLLGTDMAAELVARFALSSIENYAEAEARVRRNKARDVEEAAMGPVPDWELDDIDDAMDDEPITPLIADADPLEKVESAAQMVAKAPPLAKQDIASAPADVIAHAAAPVASKRTFYPAPHTPEPAAASADNLATSFLAGPYSLNTRADGPADVTPLGPRVLSNQEDKLVDTSPIDLPKPAIAPKPDLSAISKTHTDLLLDQIRHKSESARMAAQQRRAQIDAESRTPTAS